MKVLDGTINSRARESRDTRDEGDASSPQPFGIEGSDEVLLPLIEVGEQPRPARIAERSGWSGATGLGSISWFRSSCPGR
jgi:hypothetical protein